MTDAPQNTENQLQTALTHHRAGRLEQAEPLYQQILAVHPNHAEALHLQGVLAHQTGRNQLALEYLTKAIRQNPNSAAYYDHLGSIYRALDRLEEAIISYQQCLALKPEDEFAHYNLGVALSDQGCLAEGIRSLQRAIALNPELAEAHHSLGLLYKKCGEVAAAVACFREVLRIQPDNHHAAYLIALLSGAEQEQAPASYIANVFDGAAAIFDQHLVQTLHYDTPLRLQELVTQIIEPKPASCDILDLGCGTGLMGTVLAPYARTLTGVDLSSNMLEKAQARQLYQRLEQAELVEMMLKETVQSYDLIVAADVFIYIGKLDAVFTEARRLLRPNGLFVFSVEALDALADAEQGKDYRLNPCGRFAHAIAYIKTLAAQSGFLVSSATLSDARLENGKPVAAWLLALLPS